MNKMAKAYYKIKGVFPHAKIGLAYDSGRMRLDCEWSDKFCFDVAIIIFFNAFPIESNFGYINIYADGSIHFTGPYDYGYYATSTGGNKWKNYQPPNARIR